MSTRSFSEVNKRIDAISENIQSSWIEWHDDNTIIVDGTYSLEELKAIINAIEGVPSQ